MLAEFGTAPTQASVAKTSVTAASHTHPSFIAIKASPEQFVLSLHIYQKYSIEAVQVAFTRQPDAL
jgi:hypothetical protein